MADRKRVRRRLVGSGLLLAALACVSALPAQPEGNVPEGEVPLFNKLEVNPQTFAVLGVGAAAAPGLPSAQLLSVLYAGEHPRLRAWSLEGMLSSRNGRALVATATMLPLVAGSGPQALTALTMCEVGDHLECWTLINTDEVRPIPKSVLEWITDQKPIRVGMLEVEAYTEFLVRANQTSTKAFEEAAIPHVTYAHLFNEPAKYRGKVVQFDGRLKRLRRWDPPEEAVVRGVRDLYEGWMFDPEYFGANPICIVFTELPKGLQVGKAGEKMDQRVSFAGYFYKKYRYDANGTRYDAPLIVGHTVTVLGANMPPEMPPGQEGWARDLLPFFVGVVFMTIGTVLALALWFRRSDSLVKRRVAATRLDQELVLPLPDEPAEETKIE